jgi:taurine transport system permease protein
MVKGEQNYYLWEHLIASLQRIGVGVGWAILFGPALGFIMASFKPVATIVEPYLNFLRALPPLGYIGILIVWFGIGDTSKMWLLFLAAFPPIALSVLSGVRSPSPPSTASAASERNESTGHCHWGPAGFRPLPMSCCPLRCRR